MNRAGYFIGRWRSWYRHHRTQHERGVWESATWAWWNVMNPVKPGGGGIYRNQPFAMYKRPLRRQSRLSDEV